MLTFLSENTCGTRHKATATSRKSTFFRRQNLTQLTFSNLPNPPRMLPGHDVIHIPGHILSLGFLFWHLWTTHPPCARLNTCAQVCTSLTHVLSPTKPKGKIYKTKSLGHYITAVSIIFINIYPPYIYIYMCVCVYYPIVHNINWIVGVLWRLTAVSIIYVNIHPQGATGIWGQILLIRKTLINKRK